MQEQFIRKTMKRVAAIGTGVAMVGATLTGAMALDLSEYPSPFVVDGVYDDSNALVVGDNADAADTLGLVDISSELQYESRVAVESSSSDGSVSVSGGTSEQVPAHLGLSNASLFDTTLQDDDVASLFDGTIDFQGSSYDTSEELQIKDRTDPSVETSLTSADDDYKSDVYLEVKNRDTIKFNYKFDESINLRASTTTDPLEIDFLGTPFKITSVAAAGNEITAYVGDEHYLAAGESVDVEVDGETKTVTLTDVSSTSAVVDVDGESKIINDGSTTTVNGVEITVDSVFSRTERAESSANLIIGAQSSETYTDGEAFLGEDTDDPMWVWNLEGLDQNGTAMNLSIENDFVYNGLDSGAVAVGECVSLPNEYVEICFDSLSVSEDDYATYTFEYESSSDLTQAGLAAVNSTSLPTIHISTAESEGLDLQALTTGANVVANVSSNVKAREVWLYTLPAADQMVNGSLTSSGQAKWLGIFYKDTSTSRVKFFGEIDTQVSGTDIFRVNYGNTKDTNIVFEVGDGITQPGTAVNMSFALNVIGDQSADLTEGYDDLFMIWGLTAANGSIKSLGDTLSTEEASELKWNNQTAGTRLNIGTKDEDHRSAYGIIIQNPKSNGASDAVELSIPQDQVKANIVIQGTSTTVSSDDGTTYEAVEVTPVTKLASEVGSASDYNLILVGGPCANSLVEDLFAYTCDGWSFQEGEAVVKLVDNGDKVAMLVAGTTADDTRRAAKAVADYASYDFSGSEVMVSGTSDTDIDVTSTA